MQFSQKPDLSKAPVNKPPGSSTNPRPPEKPQAPQAPKPSAHKYERLHEGRNIEGAKGLREDLKLILRNHPEEYSKLNSMLSSYRISPEKHNVNTDDLVDDILKARFDPNSLEDKYITPHEATSFKKKSEAAQDLIKLQREKGRKIAMRTNVLRQFFDYLKDKKK